MKRIIAVLLTLMMALGLTACGSDNAQVTGTWKWNCDITELFQEGVNQGAGMDLSVDAAVEMVFVLALNEDGTYTLSVDREALAGSVRSYLDAMVPVAVEMVYQQLEDQGMNRADIDEAMEAEGVTVEEYVQQMLDAMDVDQMVDGLEDESESGYFRAAKGKLYFSDKADTFSDDSCAEYTLSGGTMQWTGGSYELFDNLDDLHVELPVQWVKQ